MKKQTWLGLDPGTNNFGVGVVTIDQETDIVKPRFVGLLEQPLKNLTANAVGDKKRRGKPTLKRDEASFQVALRLFVDEIDYLFTKYKITHVAMERYMNRGRFGDTIESVSMMIGIICAMAQQRNITFYLVSAGVWKNAIARQGGDLESLYEHGKIKYRLTPHEIDAIIIGLWHANKELPWASLLPKIMKQVQNLKLKLVE